MSIPVVDVSSISLIHADVGYKKYSEVGEKLSSAFREFGFAYLSNHGVPENIVKECFEQSKEFFDLPIETKKMYSRGIQDIHGYSSVGREVLENKNTIESKESFDITDIENLGKKYPDKETPNLRPKVRSLAHLSVILAQRLLRSLADNLGTDPIKFLDSHSEMFGKNGKNASSLRLLHYPPVDGKLQGNEDNKKVVTRCGVHTDYGGMTMLYQDSLGGLEIQDLNGKWIQATPIPNTIVVNIGDLLQYWSGGLYRATPHRVTMVTSGEDSGQEATSGHSCQKSRYSIALFIHPNHNVDISPIKRLGQKVEEKHEGIATRGRGRTAEEHVSKRFSETYHYNN